MAKKEFQLQSVQAVDQKAKVVAGINDRPIEYGSQIGGAGKPAEGATAGSTFGVNITGGGSADNQVSNQGYVTTPRVKQLVSPVAFTAGENISTGDALYYKTSDNKVWKTDADADESAYNFLGFSRGDYSSGEATVQIITDGVVTRSAWGLTAGTKYYLSGTAGIISSTVGSRPYFVGIAISSTELLIMKKQDLYTPVADGTYTLGLKLTGGGVNGTITVQNGIITAIQQAT